MVKPKIQNILQAMERKMKTIEIEVALMMHYGIRQNIIVPNVYWGIDGLYYECDIVKLTMSNYATEIEIKVSKSDLLKDKEKMHGHISNLFKYLYFAVPEELVDIALSEIPQRAGLFSVSRYKRQYTWEKMPYNYIVTEVRKPQKNKGCHKWTDEQRHKLAKLGAMRILALKKKLIEKEML